MNEHLLQLILEYKMTKEEALAFHIAVLYMEMSRKYFPEYKHANLPKKGDPRKSSLFKYCWKMMHDNKDRLPVEDYRHYIQAQMSILKNIRRGEEHPYIDPNCLVGEQAWARWCVWKKYFTAMKNTSIAPEETNVDIAKEIKKALQESHYALTVRLGDLTKDKVLSEMPTILRWVRANIVSPVFIALSPTAQYYIEKHKPRLGFDLPQVEGGEVYYKELFRGV